MLVRVSPTTRKRCTAGWAAGLSFGKSRAGNCWTNGIRVKTKLCPSGQSDLYRIWPLWKKGHLT